MHKFVWVHDPFYHNPYDMSWEEEHVCILCGGLGCASCTPEEKKRIIPIRIVEPPKEAKKSKWETYEEEERLARAEVMRSELPWIIEIMERDEQK